MSNARPAHDFPVAEANSCYIPYSHSSIPLIAANPLQFLSPIDLNHTFDTLHTISNRLSRPSQFDTVNLGIRPQPISLMANHRDLDVPEVFSLVHLQQTLSG
jgi:hypothetical protein